MSSRGEALLEVRGLSKTYRRDPVLRKLDLRVDPGEAVAVIGSNGAGKSTLLGCITGNRLPDRGEIRVCGADPFSDLRSFAKCIGSVPEHPYLYGELTVEEMLRFVIEARELEPTGAWSEVERLLQAMNLAGVHGVLCRELSQGMGRKVAIIAALLHEPKLLVLDEVLNGLDRSSAEELVSELDRRRADGAAVLLSSHDLGFLADWCDRGILLKTGGTAVALHGEEWVRWRNDPVLDTEAPAAAAPYE